MPTYEYRCKDCGNQSDVVQSFTDDALTTCDVCGGPLRKLFGNVGIAFKGSGFYKNDSRGKSATTATASPSSDSSSSSTDSSSSNGASNGSNSTDSTKKADAPKKAETSTTKKADTGSKST